MSSGAIQLESVDTFDRWRCPACEVTPSDLYTVKDSDTLTPTGFSDQDDERFSAVFHLIECPVCHQTIYGVEIMVLTDPIAGQTFIDDRCWTAEATEKFVAKMNGLSWDVTRHQEVQFDDERPKTTLVEHCTRPVATFEEASELGNLLAKIALGMK